MLLAIFVAAVAMFAASGVHAQQFFGGGAIAFAPEISTVQSGAVSSVTATVSADRKYVTIGMRAQNSSLLDLQDFQFQTPLQAGGGAAQGFVGAVNPTGAPNVPADSVSSNSSSALADMNSPDEIDRRAIAARSVLSRRGMFLLRVN